MYTLLLFIDVCFQVGAEVVVVAVAGAVFAVEEAEEEGEVAVSVGAAVSEAEDDECCPFVFATDLAFRVFNSDECMICLKWNTALDLTVSVYKTAVLRHVRTGQIAGFDPLVFHFTHFMLRVVYIIFPIFSLPFQQNNVLVQYRSFIRTSTVPFCTKKTLTNNSCNKKII